ncbi:hypothetical protein [endosymbiont GvMRE of Glomus versiforme]|uniref:hypothetical protein n=1 Tax=endosymbiont GvMRE of Glomus versiforme TaxID=2039283 RepID=UPI000EE95CFA|nr:hypothetical protein [endosymbiont GvMRE of Glomus versiforme]RHZ36772.1 hypothetical protein GvMRE_I2g172 [endosymbiont GvMRE of Glomus versiforme]
MPISNLDKLHYSFCSDLGDKVVVDGDWPEKINFALFTANLAYLEIDDNKQIRIHWAIKANPAGTYVVFRSGHIFFKWKIEVRQGIVNMTLVKVMIDGVSQSIKGGMQAIGSFFGVNTSGVDKAKEEIAGNLVGKDKGKDFMKREKDNRNQEQHTARMFQSALSHTGDNPIEPSIFYANTVKFPYNLFDFWLRTEQKAFICRFYYSNNLLNNLKHNNNENPITYPLNITFEKLGNILKPGFYQGKLTLDYDPDGKMAECFARGITFYEDKKKHFVNPDLGVKEAVNRIQYSSFGTSQGYTAQAVGEGEETVDVNRPKGNNYHQRGHYFIEYEDGTQEHWMALYPMFRNEELADGHTHGAFTLEFPKPVKKFVDIYSSCIGCGAQDTPLFDALHNNYRNGSSDSWDTIHKGLPFEPWFSAMGAATSPNYDLTVNGTAGRLGSQGDVWEKATQQKSDGKPFSKAYGFVPDGNTITWRLGGGFKLDWQKIPGQDDFEQLDWTPPAGSGGEIEILLSDPEINVPEPGEGDIVPDNDFPEVDPFDPGGGEPEIPPIEPDIPPDIDPADPDEFPDIDPPPIEPDPPEVDPNEPDPGQDPDKGEPDIPSVDPDDDPDGD